MPRLIPSAEEGEAQLKIALAQLEAMTVGKTDPAYAAALEAVRKASAAVAVLPPNSPHCRPGWSKTPKKRRR